jgi:transketolase
VYDSNDICLDGPTAECFKEDVAARYRAYGFNVTQIDGYDFDQMESAFNAASDSDKPSLIIAKTVIGKYTPNREGTSKSHGAFLGPELDGFKKSFGWPDTPFYIPEGVPEYFGKMQPVFEAYESEWNSKRDALLASDPSLAELWDIFASKKLPEDFADQLWEMEIAPDQPTRKYNEALIRKAAEIVPFLISGSADVASVDFTWLPGNPIVKKNNWSRQQIKFGVREFSMAACAYGMQLHGMIQPAVGTFLVFSDYMKNAVRMSAMMKQRVIYIYTHDSILIGQDGPTHQPVEHLMSLRLMPNLTLLRPGDENEARAAWTTALELDGGPVAICFTRQPVKSSANHLTREHARDGFRRGAYVLYGDINNDNDIVIYASGSEINPSVKSAEKFEADGHSVCVVSVPSWELFDNQPDEYRKQFLKNKAKLKVSVEAGVGSGWQKFIGNEGLMISQETYGESAPEPVMADHFGFTEEKIYSKIKEAFSARVQYFEAD